MKRIISLFILAVAAVTASVTASAEERMLEEIANLPGVESTYVGPAALRLATGMNADTGNMGGLKSSVKNLKSVESLECDNSESIKKIKSFLKNTVKKLNLSLIVESKDEEEETYVYARISDDNRIDYLLVENFEKNECSVQLIHGTIQLSGKMWGGNVSFSIDEGAEKKN